MEIKVLYTEEFKNDIRKVKDKMIQVRIKKLVQRLKDNPEIGKPLKYELSRFRSVRLPPFRIIYELRDGTLLLHKFDHRERVYK